MTRIRFIRHAATEPRGRLCGSFDIPLSTAGRLELDAQVARLVPGEAPDALLTSTLRRARDVAAALGRAWSLQPDAADWAREIHCGDVEGIPIGLLQRQAPELWARNQAQRDDNFRWPGGETYAEFRGRILAGLNAIAAGHRGGRLVVVTHAGVISQTLGAIRGRPPAVWEEDRPAPLTATEITWVENRPGQILSYNDPDWR